MGLRRKRHKSLKLLNLIWRFRQPAALYGVVLVSWVILTDYQNCSPVQFSTLASIQSLNNPGVPTDPCTLDVIPTPQVVVVPANFAALEPTTWTVQNASSFTDIQIQFGQGGPWVEVPISNGVMTHTFPQNGSVQVTVKVQDTCQSLQSQNTWNVDRKSVV